MWHCETNCFRKRAGEIEHNGLNKYDKESITLKSIYIVDSIILLFL